MSTEQLANSDLLITPIGFGAWAIGGSGWEFAWGSQDDSDSIAAIHEALDTGINWIDTAAVYGLGHSEEVVARALEGGARPALPLHQVQHGLERAPPDRPQPRGRLHPPRVRGQPATAAGGDHRPVPDSLARPGRGYRGGLGDPGRAEAGGQGPPYRRVQLQRRPDEAGPGHRPDHLAPATLLSAAPRD